MTSSEPVPPPDGVSFVVCAHDAAARLRPTLGHLARQTLPSDAFEVVLVDNASTDGTAEAARTIWREAGAPAPLRVIPEPEPGLAYARRAGARAAGRAVLCFVDDDNWLDPAYGGRLLALFAAEPDVAAAGGVGVPAFAPGTAPPSWFPEVRRLYACGSPVPGAASPAAADWDWAFGAGLAVRRDLLLGLYAAGFTPLLAGRVGSALLAGDDNEICLLLRALGGRVRVDPGLAFRHFMPAGRLTRAHARRLAYGIGRAAWPLTPYWHFIADPKTQTGRGATHPLTYLAVVLVREVVQSGALLRRGGRWTGLRLELRAAHLAGVLAGLALLGRRRRAAWAQVERLRAGAARSCRIPTQPAAIAEERRAT